MRKYLNLIINLILCVALSVTMVGCDDTADARLYFELTEKPQTLDAQLAEADSELLIVRNIFEGLLRKDENGKIVDGAAQDYTKSGLTYTFNIREGAAWSDGSALTADDFVFGITRALLKETGAPFAERLYAISGAEAVHSGAADSSALGISAPNSSTLVISLSREDESFLDTLTTSVAMPCNRKFFGECKGKYGLGSEYLLSNGSYSITKWNKEDFGIRIYKNEEYVGDFEAKNYGVLISCRDDKAPIELLVDNSVDMTLLENSSVKKAEENGISIKSYQNICWVMTVNKQYSEGYRAAFAKIVAPDVYGDTLPQGFRPATSIYPAVLGVSGCEGVGITGYDREGAWSLFTGEVSKTEDKIFPVATIIYLDNSEIKPAVTAQAGHWQQHLSAFINMKAEQSGHFENMLTEENSFDFAVFPIIAKSTSLTEYLKNFGTVNSNKAPPEIQAELLADNTLIPFAFENTNIAYTAALENVVTEAQNGYIDFSFIIKHE